MVPSGTKNNDANSDAPQDPGNDAEMVAASVFPEKSASPDPARPSTHGSVYQEGKHGFTESHDTTVYRTIQFEEQTQCVECIGFLRPLEPINKDLLYWELTHCVEGYEFEECLEHQ